MRNLTAIVLAGMIAIVSLGSGTPALAEDDKGAGRNFDYWQPEWMVRDLWGPGKMPKGMMIRLLRHTIYTQYGVPKDYAGAASTPASKTSEGIATGAALYATHCASCHGTDGMGGGDPATRWRLRRPCWPT